MRAIMCKNRAIFSACNSNYIDAEWKLQEWYYKAQGCIIEEVETVVFSKCDCEHCQSLEHEFENLIEEVKKQA